MSVDRGHHRGTVVNFLLIVFSIFPAQATETTTPAPPAPPYVRVETALNSTLVYVSDYFSFVGADGQGRVTFALDNNRGRDGDAFQAEHFVVLHDQHKGWMDVAGNGSYDNPKKELIRIPDSRFFQFEGTPESGLTVTSGMNELILRIDPIPERHQKMSGQSTIWMGSAPAVLTWQERTIPGRVIYEYLIIPDFNRLRRTYIGLWKEFQGLYLSIDGTGDVYMHSQQSERIASLVGKLVGFMVLNEQTEVFDDLDITILKREFALGFYRWPTEWRITWRGAKGSGSIALMLSERKGIKNWVMGGFSMGIVRGELSYDGRTWPLYGLAELLM